MKTRLLILLSMLFALPSSAHIQRKFAVMTFDTTVHNFGVVEEGPYITCEFKFTNTGEADLIIKSVKKSCGCTSVDYPKGPIKPGDTGVIKVTYETLGRPGTFNRSITLYTNDAIGYSNILIKGVVVRNEEE